MNQKIKQGYKLLIDQASKEINTISNVKLDLALKYLRNLVNYETI